MQHHTSIESVFLHHAWMTIGSFDGVHRGHQEIVKRVVSGAQLAGAPAVVVTFFPHPAVVLGKRQEAFYINTPQERAELLGEMGIDVVITYPFTRDVAKLSALEFVSKLHRHLNLRRLIVGANFALGHGREGNTEKLEEFGRSFGFGLEVIPPVMNGDVVISSSLIRSCLLAGDVKHASRLMGRHYRLIGEVVKGDGRGKTIGIPTANLSIWVEKTIPKAGVYACEAIMDGKSWGAVVNIGYRPTFESLPVAARVEAHILDFNQEVYGREIQLVFIDRLRDEQRFESIQSLVDQIHTDIQNAKMLLGSLANR
jgi:riboflavin kinase/FMN adenylyltransferase